MQRQYIFTNAAFAVVVGGLSPTFSNQRGVDTITRVSAGVYDLTLEGGGIDAKDCAESLTIRASDVMSPCIAVGHTSDTVKRVTLTVAGVATDGDFVAVFDRVPLF